MLAFMGVVLGLIGVICLIGIGTELSEIKNILRFKR